MVAALVVLAFATFALVIALSILTGKWTEAVNEQARAQKENGELRARLRTSRVEYMALLNTTRRHRLRRDSGQELRKGTEQAQKKGEGADDQRLENPRARDDGESDPISGHRPRAPEDPG